LLAQHRIARAIALEGDLRAADSAGDDSRKRQLPPADCCADPGRAAANDLRLTGMSPSFARNIATAEDFVSCGRVGQLFSRNGNDAILPRARSSPFCGDHYEALRMTSAATGEARSIDMRGVLKAATYTLELIAIRHGLFRSCRVRAAGSLDQSDRDAAVAADRLGAGARAVTAAIGSGPAILVGGFFLHRCGRRARCRRQPASRSAPRSRRWPELG